MIESEEELEGVGISCGGMNVNNLRFADDIHLIGKNEEEAQELTSKLNSASKRYLMEVSKEKSKIMVTGDEIVRLEIEIDGKKLEQVKRFNY